MLQNYRLAPWGYAKGMHREVSLGRRFAAISLDWLSSYLIAIVFFSGPGTFLERTSNATFSTPVVFFIEYFLLVALQGASAGHRIFRMRIVNFEDGRPPSIGQAFIRSVLMIIVITAITYDENGRGIHERFSKTKIILSS
jgi:uncharacterized RDD family membrane protein YckC